MRVAVQMADEDEREAVGDAGEEGHRAHHVDLLGTVQEAVDHLDAGLVHHDLRIEAVRREDAALHAHEHRGVVD